MLYRFFDCGVFDNHAEPNTTVWIEASNPNDAVERATMLLSLTWRVSADRVCVNAMGDMEYEILKDAIEPTEAGDRRLWACGSWGYRPLYSITPVLIFAAAKERRRLLDAYKAAQAHALVLADEITAEAEAILQQNPPNTRKAEEYSREAKRCRDFAAADLI